MDIDFLKSISEDQTEMMMMMMMMMHQHLEKLPADDFYGVYADDHKNHSTEFTDDQAGRSSTTTTTTNHLNNAHFMEDSNFVTPPPSTNISFTSSPAGGGGGEMQFVSRWRNGGGDVDQQKRNSSMAAMREMIFRIAAMQPIHIDPESVKPPKRRNVKISKDPQSVAARHRRERISERIRILQRLVPGGTKMDTASMLDEAIHYVKFLKNQVQTLEKAGEINRLQQQQPTAAGIGFPVPMSSGSNYIPTAAKDNYQQSAHNVPHYLGA